MAKRFAFLITILAVGSLWANQKIQLSVKALDQYGKVLEGIHFAFNGVESLPTTDTGVTNLTVVDAFAGAAVKLDLPRSVSEEWLLIDSTVHVPSAGPAEVVLVKRAELRALADTVRDATGQTNRPGEPISEGQRREILLEFAAQHGLTEENLDAAVVAFAQASSANDEATGTAELFLFASRGRPG